MIFFKLSVDATIWLMFLILFSELYEFDDEGVQSIYWNVNYPWPMSNRDVSFKVLWGQYLCTDSERPQKNQFYQHDMWHFRFISMIDSGEDSKIWDSIFLSDISKWELQVSFQP